MGKKVMLPVIKDDVVITIEVSGGFYKMLKDAVIVLVENLKEPLVSLEKIQSNGQLTLDEYVIRNHMMMIKSIEEAAVENNLTVDEEFEIPDEEILPTSPSES